MKASDFTVLIIRLFLGFVFFSSGLCKLSDGNFGQLIGPPHVIAELAEYGLGGFGKLIAVSQVLIGSLILTQRFSLPGLIALVPMNVSILGVTLSMHWQGTPFVNAFLLLLNIICIVYELQTIKILFVKKPETIYPSKSIRLFPSLQLPVLVLVLSLFSIFFSEKGGIALDILASITLLLIIINLFQNKHFLLSEKLVLFFFGLTVLLVVNFRILNDIRYSEYFFIGVIITGFLSFMFSIIQRIKFLNKQTQQALNDKILPS